MFLRYAPAILAVALILAAGAIHGSWTNRWDDSPELDAAVAYLPKLPKTIGRWVGVDTPQTEEQLSTFARAELRVAVVRTYKHQDTGATVDIMAVCGPPGPIGTHTPEACYGGSGYTLELDPAPIELPATNPDATGPNGFWVGDFRDGRAVTHQGLKIYWSFRPAAPTARWEASTKPRGEFALYRALYKLYVIRPMLMAGPSPIDDDVTPEFLHELLPALERAVFDAQKAKPQAASAPPAQASAMLPRSNAGPVPFTKSVAFASF
jgi:hypothetical protein